MVYVEALTEFNSIWLLYFIPKNKLHAILFDVGGIAHKAVLG
jgi:hypothetical protein